MNHHTLTISLPIDALASATSRPEFVRIPRSGAVCPHTGLGRAMMYRVIQAGGVETRKMNDSRNGVCLVRFASLSAAIERLSVPGGAVITGSVAPPPLIPQ